MPQRFELGYEDALEHSVAWTVTEDGREVELPGGEPDPQTLLEVLEEYCNEQ